MEEGQRAGVLVALGRLERGGSEEATDWLLHCCLHLSQAGLSLPPSLAPRVFSVLAEALQREVEEVAELALHYMTRGRGLLHLLALRLLACHCREGGSLSLTLLDLASTLLKAGGKEDSYCELVSEVSFPEPAGGQRTRGRRCQRTGSRRKVRQRSVLAGFPDLGLEGGVGQCENLSLWEPELAGSSEEEQGDRGRQVRLDPRPQQGFHYYDRGDLARCQLLTSADLWKARQFTELVGGQ